MHEVQTLSHEIPTAGSFAVRPRRLRESPILRELVADTRLDRHDFVYPLFVRPGHGIRKPIASMPGQFQWSPDTAVLELKRLASEGLRACMLFGVTENDEKDATGSHALDPDNVVCQTLRAVKSTGVDILTITDLCFCEYTDHGHCGPLTPGAADSRPVVDNDATASALAAQALVHARAGADVIAPSGMMDHAVGIIRQALDADGLGDRAILSYAVKYASGFYGPFRDAAESPPQRGDRRGYQMDFRRGSAEAIREAALDIEQGADIIMVKPGMPYLDILREVSRAAQVPCAAYQVSGEYAMIMAAAGNGWLDEKQTVLETMHAFKRAGAAFVLTYFAPALLRWL
jgi:porphobilinogen synthase